MKHDRKTIILRKLRRGERCWPAEVVLRASGVALLGLCALLMQDVIQLVHRTILATPSEFALAALGFFCLTGGLALLLFGPRLFKLMPMPPRALLP